MKRTIAFGFIAACSVTLNIVFVTMWLLHAAPRFIMPQRACRAEQECPGKCPMYKTLELTDSQWGVLKPGIDAYRHVADSLSREIAVAREAMLAELGKTPADTAALTACRNRILDGQRKMQEAVVANVLEQKKVLTPEQSMKFIEKVRSDMSCGKEPGIPGGCRLPMKKGCSNKENGDR
jgi:Spy/CpxP family protein refolding chaperone